MFRTRLTHTLEVAQIARTVARALRVNEDLTEAIALAHDLGHTPFGHAGQSALNRCMRPYGGFEHNIHSLRVVDELEQRYPDFDGLNLLFETREGILKHCSVERARSLGDVGERFLLGRRASLEAQIANVADEIAYNHHDIDDGLRSGILSVEDICEHDTFREAMEETRGRWPESDRKRTLYTAIRAMLGTFVSDLIEASLARIDLSGVTSVEQVRDHRATLVDFSSPMRDAHTGLKRILRRRLYEDEKVRRFAGQADTIVAELFTAFMQQPELIPHGSGLKSGESREERARIIADYIAGMTDRFAVTEYERIFGGDADALSSFRTAG